MSYQIHYYRVKSDRNWAVYRNNNRKPVEFANLESARTVAMDLAGTAEIYPDSFGHWRVLASDGGFHALRERDTVDTTPATR